MYAGVALDDNRDVLITVVKDQSQVRRMRHRRFQSQRRAVVDGGHPALAEVRDLLEDSNAMYLIVARPDGIPLSQLLLTGPLKPDRALACLAPVADLLDERSEQGRVSGDLHPANIFVGGADEPSVTQLGLLDVRLLRTSTQVSADLLAYTAPEMLFGQDVDPRSDSYSFATILFEVLTGRLPFELDPTAARTPARAVLVSRRAAPVALTSALLPAVRAQLRPGDAQELDAVVARALSPHRNARVSAGVVVDAAQNAFRNADLTPEPRDRPVGRIRPVRGTARRSSKPSRPAPPPQVVPHARRRATRAAHVARIAETPHALRREKAPAAQTPRARVVAGAEPDERGPTTRGLLFGVLLAALVVCGAIAGWALGSQGSPDLSDTSPATTTRRVQSDAVRLEFPSSWQRTRSASEASVLPLRGAITLQPRLPSGEVSLMGAARAGMVVAPTTPGLLTPALQKRIRPPSAPEAVRIGDYAAYRYSNLRLRGSDRRTSIYVMPTSGGVASVSCSADPGDAWLLEECEAIAASLAPVGAKALPLGPSRDFANRLNGMLLELNSDRRTLRRILRDAKSGRGQSRRAARLQKRFGVAAGSVARLKPYPGTAFVQRDLTADLRRISDSYGSLSRAAERYDRPAYKAAAGSVKRAEASFQDRLRDLREAGYRVR